MMSFVFPTPQLAAAVEKLRKWLPRSAGRRGAGAPSGELDALLNRIRQAPAEELPALVTSLISRELWTLVFGIPFLEPGELLDRCIQIILQRWRPGFAPALWKALQVHPDHPGVVQILTHALALGQMDFFTGRPERLPDIKRALEAAQVARVLGETVVPGPVRLADQAGNLGIEPLTELYRAVRRFCLLHGEQQTFERESFPEVKQALSELRDSDYAAFVDRYLSVVPADRYQEPVMVHIRNRLGMPKRNERLNPRWESISDSSRQAFQQWWNRLEIARFFREDNERHRYWIRHAAHMQEVYHAPGADALIMIFPGVVIAEFAQTGNAAYVYHAAVFARLFGLYETASRARHASELKEKGAALEWIVHTRGYWQFRTDQLLRRLMNKG